MIAFAGRRMRHIAGEAAEEAPHARCQLGGAVGGDIGPAQRLVAVEHGTLGPGKPVGGPHTYLERRTVFARDHQHPLGDRGERRRIEPHRGAQHDAAEPFGLLRREPRDVGRDLRRDVRLGDAEMVKQRDQPRGRRQIVGHATIPSARNAAISVSL
jgi:hypothetical protein